MPIFEVGYRHWEGTRRSPVLRCWSITRTGMSLAWRSIILRRILLFSLAPLLYFAPVFFAIGYVTDAARPDRHEDAWYGLVRSFAGPRLADRLADSPESVRPAAWSAAFTTFFSWPQTIFMMLIVVIVGPGLISQDVRSKAFLLYFSKPITRAEYLAGKAGTLFFFIALQTLVPALGLYLISILFCPSIAALFQTSETILRILGVFLVIAVPSTLIMLCFSSLARETRYPAFGWMAFCVMGEVSYGILSNMSSFKDSPWVCCLSLRKTISVMTESIFDVSEQVASLGVSDRIRGAFHQLESPYSANLCLVWLAIVSCVALLIVVRRISAPMRL